MVFFILPISKEYYSHGPNICISLTTGRLGGVRCNDTLGFIITSAAFGTGAHCLQSCLFTCLYHLPLSHLGPFVHGDFVILKLFVAVQQHLLWFGAQTKSITFSCNMFVSPDIANANLSIMPATKCRQVCNNNQLEKL